MKQISLKHLNYLTDDFGIWQHTKGKKIDKNRGYALDDSARALLVALKYNDLEKVRIYINFLKTAISKERIVNFFSKEKKPLPIDGSEDAIGEAYWALAEAFSRGFYYKEVSELLAILTPKIYEMKSVRGRAYSLLGAINIDQRLAKTLTKSLLNQFNQNADAEWPWLESELTYANAIVPLALMSAFEIVGKQSQQTGLLMLNFLNKVCEHNSVPIVIGSIGWHKKGSKKALFDQQPIDATYMVLANVKAWEQTGQKNYLLQAKKFVSWFWGNNILGLSLIDLEDESCQDGIAKVGLNTNRGAENIVCYLLAQETMSRHLVLSKKKINYT